MTPLQVAIEKVVNMVPCGKVVSYSQVAVYIGVPRGARMVGWLLAAMETKSNLPWWRVINNKGRISIKGNRYNSQDTQKKLLQADGVEISEDYTLDMKKYRFYPNAKQLKQLQLTDEYTEILHSKGHL